MFFSAAKGHEILKYARRDLGHLGNIPGTESYIIAISFDLPVVLFTISRRKGNNWLSQPSLITFFPIKECRKIFHAMSEFKSLHIVPPQLQTGLTYRVCTMTYIWTFPALHLGFWICALARGRPAEMKGPDSCSRPSQTVGVLPLWSSDPGPSLNITIMQ